MAYEWGEHVGELELHVTARDEAAVFAEALRAFAELLGDGDPGNPAERFEVAAAGGDRATLFAAWLAELAFLAETEGLVPVNVDEVVLGAGEVRAVVRGYRGNPPHLVKAVTYHRLTYERCDGGWRARAVLDV
jgi:SHS2 domain-containing protein